MIHYSVGLLGFLKSLSWVQTAKKMLLKYYLTVIYCREKCSFFPTCISNLLSAQFSLLDIFNKLLKKTMTKEKQFVLCFEISILLTGYNTFLLMSIALFSSPVCMKMYGCWRNEVNHTKNFQSIKLNL